MKEQLKLTKKHLLKIGFIEKIYPATSTEKRKVTYQIPCLNGIFYCNRYEDVYRWYQKIVIGENCNFICLDITELTELFTILSVFRVKFNINILGK